MAWMNGEDGWGHCKSGLPFLVVDWKNKSCSCPRVILPAWLSTCVSLFFCFTERFSYHETKFNVNVCSQLVIRRPWIGCASWCQNCPEHFPWVNLGQGPFRGWPFETQRFPPSPQGLGSFQCRQPHTHHRSPVNHIWNRISSDCLTEWAASCPSFCSIHSRHLLHYQFLVPPLCIRCENASLCLLSLPTCLPSFWRWLWFCRNVPCNPITWAIAMYLPSISSSHHPACHADIFHKPPTVDQ